MDVFAGVDCHKESHAIIFVAENGRVIRELSIAADLHGYAEAIATGSELGHVKWGLEGTGVYGRAFANALLAANMDVYEVPGAFTKRHRKHSSRHGKSDRADALAIAEAVLREADRLPRFREFAEQEALRLRYDQRDRLIRERTAIINRLRSQALRLGVISLPSKITRRNSIQAIKAAVEAIRTGGLVKDALIDDLLYDISSIERINDRVAAIELAISPLVRSLAPELLALRGVSIVTAAGLIGHTGDLRNTRNADAFAMRSATAPVPWSSGKNQGVRINTGGNRQLNRLLYITALVQLRFPNQAGRLYYDRKCSEGKSPKAAMRSLKRQLATVVYYRLRLCQERIEQRLNAVAA